MPELPEVETIVNDLRSALVGQRIVGFHNNWPGHLVMPDLAEFRQRIHQRTFLSAGRRAKYLVFGLDGRETLIIHLKMSGRLLLTQADFPTDRYVHTVFSLANGCELRFHDVRKFGRVYLVHDPDQVLGGLGIEPLSQAFSQDWLHENLRRRKRVVKPLLLDQTFIAGIGNIYADEALYLARVHPTRYSNSLSSTESRALHAAIRQTLQDAIDRGGATIDDYRKPDGSQGEMQHAFKIYGRTGEPCYRCGSIVEKMVLGGRGTHFCSQCQER